MTSNNDPPEVVDRRIQFVRHNFDNYQSLNRASDTKAAVYVTMMVFLAGTSLGVVKDATAKLCWFPSRMALLSGIFLIAVISLFIAILRTFVMVHRVLKTRGPRFDLEGEKTTNLMWQDHILLSPSSVAYFEAVQEASQRTILRNLTDQVFELAHISSEKMDALRSARRASFVAAWSWAALIGFGMILLSSK